MSNIIIIHMVIGYHVVNSVIYKSHAIMEDYSSSLDNIIIDAI
jgi:hypothetical protein